MSDSALSAVPAGPQDAGVGIGERLREQVLREARRDDARRQITVNLWRVGLLVAILVIWEVGSGRFLDEFFVSKPSDIGVALAKGFSSKNMFWHLEITVYEAVAGYIIGVVTALLFALAIAVTGRAYEVLEPFIVAIYGVPRIALAPLFIMWFGIGITPKIIISAFMVFFVVFMNTISGVHSTNPHFINISRILGASYWQLMTKVIVPSAMPYILTALRIVVPTAMIGAIVGEFISSQRGLGFFISRSTFMFDTASAFAGILMLLVVILVMNETVNRLESRLMRWQREGKSAFGGNQGR